MSDTELEPTSTTETRLGDVQYLFSGWMQSSSTDAKGNFRVTLIVSPEDCNPETMIIGKDVGRLFRVEIRTPDETIITDEERFDEETRLWLAANYTTNPDGEVASSNGHG